MSPAVRDALVAAGFTVEARFPLMTVDPAELVAPTLPAGVSVLRAESDQQLRQAAEVGNAAYGEPATTSHDVDRLRRTVDNGGGVGLALAGGEPAGSGVHTPPRGAGLAEIAAVGVATRFRRRGIAVALVHDLSRRVFEAGARPYLQAEPDAGQPVYRRLGYRVVGELTAVSLLATRV